MVCSIYDAGKMRRLTEECRQPLCDFLEVPVPDTPFPTGNTQAEFQTRVLAKKAELIVSMDSSAK